MRVIGPKLLLRGLKRALRVSDSGQALIETAFIVPVLALILIGAAEFARLAYAAIEVSNAARAAVQYGAQNVVTAIDTTGMQAAAQSDAYNLANLTVPTPTTSCQCVTNGVAVPDVCTDQLCGTAGGYLAQTLQVTTATSFDPLIHIPGLPTTITLQGYAAQEVLQ